MPAQSTDRLFRELNSQLTRLRLSVAQYILGSAPYLKDVDKEAMGAVREIAGAEEALAVEATDLIDQLDGVPQVGLSDPLFADINYSSFPYLIGVMIRWEQREVERCAAGLEAVADNAEAKGLVEKILALHEGQLAKLQDIRARRYPTPNPTDSSAGADEAEAAT